MLYGAEVWDPVYIVAQIGALQCIYYVCSVALVLLLVGPYAPPTVSHILDWRWLRLNSFQGFMVLAAGGVNAVLVAVAIRFVVVRAKKCLDFSATLYILHTAIVWAYSGFPRYWQWWLVTVGQFVVTAFVSEWLCLHYELKEIPISSLANRNLPARAAVSPAVGRSAANSVIPLIPMGSGRIASLPREAQA